MTVINLDDYRISKEINNNFEHKYQELLSCLGTPKTIPEIFKNFYCSIRYIEGILNSIRVLETLGMIREHNLSELKENMISCLQSVIDDVKEM